MSFEEEVATAIKGVTKNDEGKTVYPEGTSDAIIYAANAEFRRRDTQSALTKAQQENTVLATENTKLAETWEQEVSGNLTTDQRTELEELKVTDPDAWRQKLNTYETENSAKTKEKRKQIAADATKESEVDRRTRVLAEYNEANPRSQLTDDIVANDVPPRITNKLEKGEITFDEFIAEASEYLGKEKVVGGEKEIENDIDISDLGGSDTPTPKAVESEITTSYDNELY